MTTTEPDLRARDLPHAIHPPPRNTRNALVFSNSNAIEISRPMGSQLPRADANIPHRVELVNRQGNGAIAITPRNPIVNL
jgi:hypothetical protein